MIPRTTSQIHQRLFTGRGAVSSVATGSGRSMDFIWAIHALLRTQFPKIGKYPERNFHVTADVRGATRSVSQKNAPPLDKTVLNLKRLLKHSSFPEVPKRHILQLFLFLISRVHKLSGNRRLSRN